LERRSWRPRRSFWRADRGNAAIEFALVGPMLVLFAAGLLDAGAGYWDYLRVRAAVRSGAAYASNNDFDATSIQNAVLSGGPATLTASPAPVRICGCPDKVNGVIAASGTPPSCTGICPSGGNPGTYVRVYARLPYKTLFPWPAIKPPTNFSASTVVRTQ
jgi:hypothetical protein